MSSDTYAYGSISVPASSEENLLPPAGTHHLGISPRSLSTPSINRPLQNNDVGCEELFKDSVPCPSCRGLGRVPKDQENELVALIPMRDKRLKPRRTVLYVLLATLVCIVVAALCMFFLFPRDVVVTSDRPLLQAQHIVLNISASFVNFTVTNFYNFTNNNYFDVKIQGAQMTSRYGDRMMATASNTTVVNIPLKSLLTYAISMDFILTKDNQWEFLVSFCTDSRSWVHNLPITFALTANYSVLGHAEQSSIQTTQPVSCYNSSALHYI